MLVTVSLERGDSFWANGFETRSSTKKDMYTLK